MTADAVCLVARPMWHIDRRALFQDDEEAATETDACIHTSVDAVWRENDMHGFSNVSVAKVRWTSRATLTVRLWSTVVSIGSALGYPRDVVHAMTDPILYRFSVNPLRAFFAYRMLLLLWGITKKTWSQPGWATAVGEDKDTWVERARHDFFAAIGTDPDTGEDVTRHVAADDVCAVPPPEAAALAARDDLGWLTEGVPSAVAALFLNEVRSLNSKKRFSPGAATGGAFTSWSVPSNSKYGYTTSRAPSVSSAQEMSQFVFEDQNQRSGGGVLMTILPAGVLQPAPTGAMAWLDAGVDGAPAAEDDVDVDTTLCALIVAYSVQHGIVRTGIVPYSVDICNATRTCPLPRTMPAPRNVRMQVPVILASALNGVDNPEPMRAHVREVVGVVKPVVDDADAEAAEVLKRNNSHWSVATPKFAGGGELRRAPTTDTPNTRRLMSQSLSEDVDVGSDDLVDGDEPFAGVENRAAFMEELFGPTSSPESTAKGRKRAKPTPKPTPRPASVDDDPPSDAVVASSDEEGPRVRRRRVCVDSSDSE